ncbi:hypothetical protein NL108_016525 [Boleophthalmus pectinirostris]|uniref:ring-infected erythrocyte surface antigen-like n=1 Tax=Boleophthalmus pectinirostris TaxID=150288 RepID=UPI0024306AED|nr:ring-infected erythrocyte surface antigen-like [Boleophthalmus pectinirostris]KAJ0062157.1 hypothetical protein NL108_016525 [Boleophthalmus pectinirostris]
MASLLREYLWLWVVLMVLLLSTFICLIFVCINRWIWHQGKHIFSLNSRPAASLQKNSHPVVQSVNSVTPPLPPRTQFVNEVALDRSYENLAEEPDYEDPDENPGPDLDPDHRSSLPDYLMLESDPGPDPHQENREENREENQEENREENWEENWGENEEDYDDITAEDEKEADEDYDDVR